MLDFDSLAAKRARSLNETEDQWREALWGAAFQKLAQSMSDGEVEGLVASCPSLNHFERVVEFLSAHPDGAGSTPYMILVKAAQALGVSVDDWILSLANGRSS